ncbi:MAG TPA: ATP-binding protein [Anaeromyxobacteraceae bacterium]|nr:ATP-binding protein [Anaeromyxobacteraceae bacterium]
MSAPAPRGLLSVEVRRDEDVVLARQRARQLAELLGFLGPEATRLATAVSEVVRNAWRYAGGGRVEFALTEGGPAALRVEVRDRGRGIPDLAAVMEGRYVSRTGMGMGLAGSRRLVDRFDVTTGPGGTMVVLEKDLPARAAAPDVGRIAQALARAAPHDALTELTAQNQELLRTLEQLRERERELSALNEELEDTNRGVVALYAELDEKADYLRRASELKSRFLSNMSHEFRTPLNTVISFCRILLDETDGPLNAEQRIQVGFARKAAEGMLELVNDLLDLAKVEAGKSVVRRAPFEVRELFGALRGMLRPLLVGTAVDLVFEEPEGVPALDTDEAKVSQILRNFISNALKFTERGEVRVSARAVGERVLFAVSDTGIGIAPEDQELIFREYGQVESHLQRRVKGTGLGLPLSRKLAILLGGRIALQSEPGVGSTFTLEVPRTYEGPDEVSDVPEVSRVQDPTRFPVLVVEDNPETVFVYEKFLKGTPFQVVPASSLAEARRAVAAVSPVAVVLDVMLGTETAWTFLSDLKSSAPTRGVPVYVVTMVDNRHKAVALGADGFAEKPLERAWLLERLQAAAATLPRERVLVVDDDPASREQLAELLAETRYQVVVAGGGAEGLARAREAPTAVVFLDLEMPDLPGEEVLRRLRDDPATRGTPVVVYTGARVDDGLRARLPLADAVLCKRAPSRAAALRQVREALATVAGAARRRAAEGVR